MYVSWLLHMKLQLHFPTFLKVFSLYSLCFLRMDRCCSCKSARRSLSLRSFCKSPHGVFHSEWKHRGMIPRFIPQWNIRPFEFVYLAISCVVDGVHMSHERFLFHILPTWNISATFWGLTEPLSVRKSRIDHSERGSQKPFARHTSFRVNNLNISSVFCPCEDFPSSLKLGRFGNSLVSRAPWTLRKDPNRPSVGTVAIYYHSWHDHLSSPSHSRKKTLQAQQTLELTWIDCVPTTSIHRRG